MSFLNINIANQPLLVKCQFITYLLQFNTLHIAQMLSWRQFCRLWWSNFYLILNKYEIFNMCIFYCN